MVGGIWSRGAEKWKENKKNIFVVLSTNIPFHQQQTCKNDERMLDALCFCLVWYIGRRDIFTSPLYKTNSVESEK